MLKLDRATLAKFLPNPQAIAVFEKVLSDVGGGLPSTIEDAQALAAQAQATAALALAMLADAISSIEQLATAPASPPVVEADDHAAARHIGTLGAQNHDAVEITGGSIDSTPIGASAPAAASFTTAAASGAITSTVPDGSAPLVVASSTKVSNLNADLLDGGDWSAPGAIGGATPQAGTFTDLTATGKFGCNACDPQPAVPVSGGVATTAATNVSPYGFSTAAQANAIVTKLNTIITALTANGILS